jgi:hypothetical protein
MLESAPQKPEPRLNLAGTSIATPGNIACLAAQAKLGKSSAIGAAISAIFVSENKIEGRDCLSFGAAATNSRAVLLIDTEQSAWDAFNHIARALRRAGIEQLPDWFHSYQLAGYGAKRLRKLLPQLLEALRLRHGGIFLAILDGVADFVEDPNDQRETNPFVSDLHALAIQYDCPILCIIHENPGSETGKTRGHLGSQLARKAETNLRLKKTDGVTVIFSEQQRGAPILESNGPRFVWSDEEGMHISVQSIGDTKAATKRMELLDLAHEVFGGNKRLKWAEIHPQIMSARDCSKATAERRINEMKKLNVIRSAGFGLWEIYE